VNMLHAKVLAVFNHEDTLVGAVGVGAGLFTAAALKSKRPQSRAEGNLLTRRE